MATTIASQETKRDRFARKAEVLKAEIDKISDSLYNFSARDPESRYENLKTYRAEVIRGFVVYIYLAIEDLLRALYVPTQNSLDLGLMIFGPEVATSRNSTLVLLFSYMSVKQNMGRGRRTMMVLS